MPTYSFDQAIDRFHTQSIRWDKYGPEVIPLWVADMDFRPPPSVVQALQQRIEHGVFGYTYASESLKTAIVEYIQKRYDWPIDPQWLAFLPSVVTGLHLSVRNLTQEGDHILIPQPAYHHFKDSVAKLTREYSTYDMLLEDGRYIFSMSQLEALVQPNTRLLMICNPHNPGGTVFTADELTQLAKFAKKHELLICSDEIHADLILDADLKHVPLGSIGARDDDIQTRGFSLMSLNKAYNFPGIGMAWLVCPNRQLRERLTKDLNDLIPHPQLFAYSATQAALDDGQEWLAQLLDYLRANRNLVQQRIEHMPGLQMAHLSATYLAWIDARNLGVKSPFTFFLKAGVALSPGEQFGDAQYVRLNFGTQRHILEQALDRMEQACQSAKIGSF
jgi:cysteine-S-conjugate beta-lyase